MHLKFVALVWMTLPLAADAPLDSRWTIRQHGKGASSCETLIQGRGENATFNAIARFTALGKDIRFHVVIPHAKGFKHLNLQELAQDETPMGTGRGITLRSLSMKSGFEFDAAGSYCEDELNTNVFSFDFVLPGSKREHGTFRKALQAIRASQERWIVTVRHQGKTITLPVSFAGAQDYLKRFPE